MTRTDKETTQEAYWRDLFKRYLFVVIQEESTIYDGALERSPLITESEMITIRKLADEAEDEYES